MWSQLCNLEGTVNQQDTIVSQPAAPDHGSIAIHTSAAKRGPIGEFLDHLLSEVRQLDLRCAQLEILLHDLTIRYAAAGADPLLASELPERLGGRRRDA